MLSSVVPHGILILSRVTMYGGVFERLFPGINFRGKNEKQTQSIIEKPSSFCSASALLPLLTTSLLFDNCS